MHKLCEYLDDELTELEKKIKNGGELSKSEIEFGKDCAKFKTALLTNEAMEKSDYSSEYRGDSYGGRRRDSMGRYSRAEAVEDMKHDIRKAMPAMPEHLRRDAESFLGRVERDR